jgi:hypothetical protein
MGDQVSSPVGGSVTGVRQYSWKRSYVCKLCGTPFPAEGPGTWCYCSETCRTKINTTRHAEYVSKNRSHIRAYGTERNLRTWGVSNRVIAEAERFAAARILPRLGFSDICHLSLINSFFPFDLAANYQNERVLIDVTTAVGKSLRRQKIIAGALRMRFLVLFVRPDLRSCYLASRVESDHVTCRSRELRKIA